MRLKKSDQGTVDKGRRAGQRREVVEEVSLFDESGEPIVLETVDLGPEGLFVRSDLLLDLGEELWVSMRIPGGPKIVVKGQVVHGQLGGEGKIAGMGIKFIDLTAREKTWLIKFSQKQTPQENIWSAFLDSTTQTENHDSTAALS